MVQLVTAIVTALFVTIPISRFDLTGFLQETKELYPRDLQVEFRDGQLTTNQELPFAISFSEAWRDELSDDFQHIIVFTTDEAIQGAVDVMNQESLVVITQTSVYALDEQASGFEVYPLPADGEPFMLTAGDLDRVVDQLASSPLVAKKLYLPLLFATLFLIMLPILIIFGFVVVFFYGLLVWIVTKLLAGALLAGQSLTYFKAVQVSMHSILLVNILQTVLAIFGYEYWLSGWWHLGAFLLWTAFVLYRAHHPDEEVGETVVPVLSTKRSRKTPKDISV